MTNKSDAKLAEFLEEARAITQNHNFGGTPNKAMFWAHTKLQDRRFPVDRNNYLCELYHHNFDSNSYKMDMLSVIDPIFKHLDRFAGDYPPEISDRSWDIFSEAFALSAVGNHAFVAANDMNPDDYFERAELPIMKEKFTDITTLEPSISLCGDVSVKITMWHFSDWLKAQKKQWEKPHMCYLDGSLYPLEFRVG